MGGVKKDYRKNEIEWKYTPLSEIDIVKGLLKFRAEHDLMYERNNSIISFNHDLVNMTDEVICLYLDLDNAIKKCNFNNKQKEIIKLLSNGMSEKEIAEKYKCSRKNIIGMVNSICKKIVEYNNFIWKYEFIYSTVKKVNFNYKKCSKCREFKPATEEFFSPNEKGLYKLYSVCKNCD